MSVKRLLDCAEFTAGDGCRLREILHPDKETFAGRYSLAHAVVAIGQTTDKHRLRTSEVYYILSGRGRMTIDGEVTDVGPHDTVTIPPHAVQCIENTGIEELVFICMVDPAWCKEDEMIIGDQ
ncbi:cupin domain-containing protein [Planctomycetota bacterium]